MGGIVSLFSRWVSHDDEDDDDGDDEKKDKQKERKENRIANINHKIWQE